MENVRKELRESVIQLGDEKGFDAAKLKMFYGRIEDSLGTLSGEIVSVLNACVTHLPHKMHICTIKGITKDRLSSVYIGLCTPFTFSLMISMCILWGRDAFLIGHRSSST